MKRALILLLFLSACWTANPGPAAFTDAQAPVGLTARAVSGQVAWIQVAVRAGSAHDPVGREGLASLTALALREGGAGERSPDEVEQALYALGTDVEVVVDRELVTYRTRALVEDLDVIAGLLGDMLLAPVFDEAAVERIRGEAADRLDRALVARDEQLGHEVFDTWIFEGHPYGHPADGRAGVGRGRLGAATRGRVGSGAQIVFAVAGCASSGRPATCGRPSTWASRVRW